MNLKFTDYQVSCTSFDFNKENNTFQIFGKEGDVVFECTSILELDDEYDYRDFILIILRNRREEYTENSIYQVYVGDIRIGWIFPFQALISDQHNYSKDKYFLKYAYVAFCLLLNEIKEKDKRMSKSEISLDEFYSDDGIALLVIDQTNTAKIMDFDINDYTVSLFQNGFSYDGNGNQLSESITLHRRVHLQPISKELKKEAFFQEAFKTELSRDREAFVTFHILYQIIEVLIFKIYEKRFKDFVSKIENDPEDIFDKKDELTRLIGEKYRINILFNDYVSVDSEIRWCLNERCSSFLEANGKKGKENCVENLYQVRCLVVHRMYNLTKRSSELLQSINRAFIDLIIQMLISFHF